VIDLNELRDAAQKAFPTDALAPDRDASRRRIVDLGWLMIELPEDRGGLGLGSAAATTVHFEMGRVLNSAPLIPAMLGIHAVSGNAELIEQAISGAYVALPMLPTQVDEDDLLIGTISGVFDADMATYVIVPLPDQIALISTSVAGVRVIERSIWDKTRRLFDVELNNVRPDVILAEGEAAHALNRQLAKSAHLAIAADSLGGANAALAMTVEYLKLRRQFDRPLAMFQALKHRCADLKTLIANAEALLWSLADKSDASLSEFGAMKAYATDVYRTVTEEMIQLHGGIGLTEEHPCHLFMKRAILNAQLGGSSDDLFEARCRELLGEYA
jgi:alkylation response protein AidB-like acyl-CoA dehydrogenase